MQNDKTNPTAPSLVPSVDETTAVLEKEETEQDARLQGSPPKSVESTAFNTSMQEKPSVDGKSRGASSEEDQVGQDGQYLFNLKGSREESPCGPPARTKVQSSKPISAHR
jgi:hypothetical protein